MSGVRTDDGGRFWGFRRDAMATKDFPHGQDSALAFLLPDTSYETPSGNRLRSFHAGACSAVCSLLLLFVTPVKTGVQGPNRLTNLDSGFHRNDGRLHFADVAAPSVSYLIKLAAQARGYAEL